MGRSVGSEVDMGAVVPRCGSSGFTDIRMGREMEER